MTDHAAPVEPGEGGLSEEAHRCGDCHCRDCGAENVVWFTDSDLWNRVMSDPDAPGVVCPPCFIRRAEVAGIVPTAWCIAPEQNRK